MPQKLKIDFLSGPVAHRQKFGGGRGQALPRAIGMKTNKHPHVVDATAGLGRDAFLLASLGAHVTLIERSDVIHSALSEAMAHASKNGGEIASIIDRMKLIHGDAITLLPDLCPSIVLVDPMHPPRHNSALVKQELRLVRDIVGTDDDAVQLMQIALACATERVVLKWPQKARPMADLRAPSHQIAGKSTRYDVFMTQTI